jgi:hypothetical protein
MSCLASVPKLHKVMEPIFLYDLFCTSDKFVCETWVPPGSPPTRLTAVPEKWVRPTKRPTDLSVGPTDLVGGPHDLRKTFEKIPHTT